MYKDREVNKNVKNMFLSMCDVKVFLTFTSLNVELERAYISVEPEFIPGI
jgi:TATA-box binding protein (TBP) (component of TFIID and TFIIIB)